MLDALTMTSLLTLLQKVSGRQVVKLSWSECHLGPAAHVFPAVQRTDWFMTAGLVYVSSPGVCAAGFVWVVQDQPWLL